MQQDASNLDLFGDRIIKQSIENYKHIYERMSRAADMIFISSSTRIENENAWNLIIPSRALENNLFVFGVNSTATEGDLQLAGKSKACSPKGEIILQMGRDDDELSICEIELEKKVEARSSVGYISNIRTEIYY